MRGHAAAGVWHAERADRQFRLHGPCTQMCKGAHKGEGEGGRWQRQVPPNRSTAACCCMQKSAVSAVEGWVEAHDCNTLSAASGGSEADCTNLSQAPAVDSRHENREAH
eukprot:364707-Chlamydomonas_euryale.AAC.29